MHLQPHRRGKHMWKRWAKCGLCLILAAVLAAGTAFSAAASTGGSAAAVSAQTEEISVSAQADTGDSEEAENTSDTTEDTSEDVSEDTGDTTGDTDDLSDTEEEDTESEKNGLYKENGSYYFYKNGELVTNAFRTVNKKTYYFGKSGKNVTGLKKINGKYYYFKSNGVMIKKAFRKVNGKTYYFGKSGKNVTGLRKINGKYYYFKPNGVMIKKAFRKVNGKTYYFAKSGKNVTGYKKINGKRYYFKKNGVMLTNTWKKIKGKKYYFTKSGARAEGVTKIGKKYYYFSSRGIRMTGFFKDGNGYYLTNYANSKPNLVAYRKGNKYYYANGKTMSAADKNEFYTLIRAYKIVQSITTESMSMSEKRLAAFKWVMKKYYAFHRAWSFSRESWPAVYALDHFDNKGGDCHSDAAAFAYLAFIIGYKNVVVCTDYGTGTENNHAWCAIDGRMYDPLFAETKSFSTYYNGPHQYAWHEYKLPLLRASNAKKSSSSKKKTSNKKSSSSSSSKSTGVVFKNGKFYYYSSSGKLNKTKTKKIRQAAKKGKDINELIKLIGKPNKRSYSDSCLIAGAQDGILKYDGFKVITLKTDEGETFVSAE